MNNYSRSEVSYFVVRDLYIRYCTIKVKIETIEFIITIGKEMTYYAVGHFDTCESLTRVSKDIKYHCNTFIGSRSLICSYGQSIQRDIIGLNTEGRSSLTVGGCDDAVDCTFVRVISASVGGVTKACH